MGCEWEVDTFNRYLTEYKEVERKIDYTNREVVELDRRREVWSHSIATAKDDLYYLDQKIQGMGNERADLNSKLDFTKDDAEQRALQARIRELDDQIYRLRNDQQRMNDDLRSKVDGLNNLDYERNNKVREKDSLIQDLERLRRELESIYARVLKECNGDNHGLSVPR